MTHDLAKPGETPIALAGGVDVSAIIAKAVETGTGVEAIERLVALQEHMLERGARSAFIDSLAAFQEEVPAIQKSATANVSTKAGGRYSYTYAPLDAIVRVVRPLLRRHGLYYSWDSKVEGQLLTCVCRLRHEAGHEDEASFTCPIEGTSGMSGPQKAASALTFAKRQSLVQVLGLTMTDDDNDAQGEPEIDAPKVTADQAANLEVLAEDVGADKQKFLRYVGHATFADIPAADHRRAVQLLESKRGAA